MSSAVAMILSGGVGLGAYQFGAYAAMDEDLRRRTTWFAGASIGAVNAALIAGNPPEQRIEALATFWEDAAAPVGAGGTG
jgi:NTE family protein